MLHCKTGAPFKIRMLIKGYIFVVLLVPNDLGFSLTFLPYLREFTTVLVSGFHAVDSGFRTHCH